MRKSLTFSHEENSWMINSHRLYRWIKVSPKAARVLFDLGWKLLDV